MEMVANRRMATPEARDLRRSRIPMMQSADSRKRNDRPCTRWFYGPPAGLRASPDVRRPLVCPREPRRRQRTSPRAITDRRARGLRIASRVPRRGAGGLASTDSRRIDLGGRDDIGGRVERRREIAVQRAERGRRRCRDAPPRCRRRRRRYARDGRPRRRRREDIVHLDRRLLARRSWRCHRAAAAPPRATAPPRRLRDPSHLVATPTFLRRGRVHFAKGRRQVLRSRRPVSHAIGGLVHQHVAVLAAMLAGNEL